MQKPLMPSDSLLSKITQEFPGNKKTTLKTCLFLSLSILQSETVCLYKLKKSFGRLTGTESRPDSHYKRMIRFFSEHAFSRLWLDILGFAFRLLSRKSSYLILDGTSWERGSKKYHFMTLCLLYRNVSVPIFWLDLNKKGISNTAERLRLFKKAMKRYDLSGKTLIADREYIGECWFKFLINNNIHFVIRSREGAYAKEIGAGQRSVSSLKKGVYNSKKRNKCLSQAFVLGGMPLQFTVLKNPDSEAKEPLIYLISDRTDSAYKVAKIYRKRWAVECCFKHLKTNGFDLEKLNLKGRFRQQLLMAVTIFAYVLSVTEGLKTYRKVAEKVYKNKKYKAVSVFRYGTDLLVAQCSTFYDFCNYLVRVFALNLKAGLRPKFNFVQ